MNGSVPGIRERMAELLQHMGRDLYEKEQLLALALLSAVAGESLFLLGPPGVAKSMLARRLKFAFREARAFEYLMGKFSTPDEVFGPVSISRLKNEDKYERQIEHYLPGAQVVFLDEIWKASPPIQNALLTVLNEKIFRNGAQEVPVDIRGLIAASNELPNKGEGLEALWDRFLLRSMAEGIEDEQAFEQMLNLPKRTIHGDPVPDQLKITDEEYVAWSQYIDDVKIPPHIMGLIHELRRMVSKRNETAPRDEQIYISDRRWRKAARLMRTAAFLQDRNQVILMDAFLLNDILWDRLSHREEVQELLLGAVVASGYDQLIRLRPLRTQLDMLQEEIAEHTRRVKRRKVWQPKPFADSSGEEFVQVADYRGVGPAYLRKTDWQQLRKNDDRYAPIFEEKDGEYRPTQRVGLRLLEDRKLRIQGHEYSLQWEEVEKEEIELVQPSPRLMMVWDKQVEQLLEACQQRLDLLQEQIEREQAEQSWHLFVPTDLARQVQRAQEQAQRHVIDLQLDIEKTQARYGAEDQT